MKKFALLILVALLVVGVTSTLATELGEPTYTGEWDGQGYDSEKCELLEPPNRPVTGWMHWVINQIGGATDARLILLDLEGTELGVFEPKDSPANVFHFYTPYFDIDDLEAVFELYGGNPETPKLVLSDFCPGVEDLDVSKTVDTYYTRTHEWDIAKKVETENDYELDDLPKIWLFTNGDGDETATWTIDVTYEGYEDDDFNVSGEITIENIGGLDAWITDIEDILGGEEIEIDCGEDFELPYLLEVGETLVCTYDEDGYFEGDNEVTVTTERAVYGPIEEPIIWGDPDEEINETVTIKDVSDLFGEEELGSVTAPNGDTFTYDKEFKWEDYGAELCGSYQYDNTATIVETEQEASATLLVNVQCFIYEYETAYAMGDEAICFIPTFSNWGWTNPILPGTYEMELWAAAGQCDTDKGTHVGTVTVEYDVEGYVTVDFDLFEDYILEETHVYAGTTMFPQTKQGKDTVAPGQYYNASPFDGSEVYVIAHAVVGIGIPDPDFGSEFFQMLFLTNRLNRIFLPTITSR
jgi:hypothetical protein